jgi:hypothetical protein
VTSNSRSINYYNQPHVPQSIFMCLSTNWILLNELKDRNFLIKFTVTRVMNKNVLWPYRSFNFVTANSLFKSQANPAQNLTPYFSKNYLNIFLPSVPISLKKVQWLKFWTNFSTILTEVFPCFFLKCKANARVKLANTGHGPHFPILFSFYC